LAAIRVAVGAEAIVVSRVDAPKGASPGLDGISRPTLVARLIEGA
jgi:hypothetical protein